MNARRFGRPLGRRGRRAGGADVVIVIAFNTFGGNTRDVQVPDVRDQVSADAIAALQNRGFKTRTQQRPDSTDPARSRHRHRSRCELVRSAPAT